MRRRTVILLVSASLIFAVALQAPAGAGRLTARKPARTKNLIRNPGADTGNGAPDDVIVIKKIPGWNRAGNTQVTAVRYGASGGFPDKHTPGPKDRGKNFFAGGPNNSEQFLSQFLELGRYLHAIHKGGVRYTCGAWLGGLQGQDDNARVEITFFSKRGRILDSVTLRANTHEKTMFVHDTKSGKVPKKTRSIEAKPIFERVSGGTYNDGYLDSMSFRLSGV